jgi:hypothetical protein
MVASAALLLMLLRRGCWPGALLRLTGAADAATPVKSPAAACWD